MLDSQSVSPEDISRDGILSSMSVDIICKSGLPPLGPMTFTIGTDLNDQDLTEKNVSSLTLAQSLTVLKKMNFLPPIQMFKKKI